MDPIKNYLRRVIDKTIDPKKDYKERIEECFKKETLDTEPGPEEYRVKLKIKALQSPSSDSISTNKIHLGI